MGSVHFRTLEGWQLSLYRFARRTGLVLAASRAYRWYRLHIRRTILAPSWFIDPLGPTQILLGMAPAISAGGRDSISIAPCDMATWLPGALTRRPDFRGEKCHRELLRWLGEGSHAGCQVTSGNHMVSYAAFVREGALGIEVLHRFDKRPAGTRGQLAQFYRTVHAVPRLDAESIAAAREQAFCRAWPDSVPEPASPDSGTKS